MRRDDDVRQVVERRHRRERLVPEGVEDRTAELAVAQRRTQERAFVDQPAAGDVDECRAMTWLAGTNPFGSMAGDVPSTKEFQFIFVKSSLARSVLVHSINQWFGQCRIFHIFVFSPYHPICFEKFDRVSWTSTPGRYLYCALRGHTCQGKQPLKEPLKTPPEKISIAARASDSLWRETTLLPV